MEKCKTINERELQQGNEPSKEKGKKEEEKLKYYNLE